MFKEELYNQKMTKTFDVFIKELASLRTGRANANMLDLIKVDVYGQKMPINQLATITTPESRVINIQVWYSNNFVLVDSAVKKITNYITRKVADKLSPPLSKRTSLASG